MQRQRKKPTLLRDSEHFTHFEADNSLELHSITHQVSPVTPESNHHDGHLPHGLAESRTGAITTSEFDQHNGHLPHGLAESRTGASTTSEFDQHSSSLDVHSITHQVDPVTPESNHHDGHLPHGLAESRTGAIANPIAE